MKKFITILVILLLNAIGIQAQQQQTKQRKGNLGFVTDSSKSEVQFESLSDDQMKKDLIEFYMFYFQKGTSLKLPSQRVVDINLSSTASIEEDLRVLNQANIDYNWGYDSIIEINIFWIISQSEVVDLENETGYFGNSSVTPDEEIEYTWMPKLKGKGLKFRGLVWKKLDCFNTIKVKADKFTPDPAPKQDDYFVKPPSEAEKVAMNNTSSFVGYGCTDCRPSSHPCDGPSIDYENRLIYMSNRSAAFSSCDPNPCYVQPVAVVVTKPVKLWKIFAVTVAAIVISSVCVTVTVY